MSPSDVLTFSGRLPGVSCSPAMPEATQTIRLDVAGMVGLAERGPLNQPFPVEDINQYHSIFGGDLVVAQDNGVPIYARLPSAVKAFFDNGGRRCWIVRVAGQGARPAQWPVPGLLRWAPDGSLSKVVLEAAWAGTWSAGITVGTQLLQQPIPLPPGAAYRRLTTPPGTTPPDFGTLPVDFAVSLLALPGDLLQLDLGPALPNLYVVVGAVTQTGSSYALSMRAEVPVWTTSSLPAGPMGQGGPILLGPAAREHLPTSAFVHSATLLRFGIVVRKSLDALTPQDLERWNDLRFNQGRPLLAGRPCWLDVVQPPASPANPEGQPLPQPLPDQSRSLILRAGAADAGAVYLPFEMDALGGAGEFIDAAPASLPDALAIEGDNGLATFSPQDLLLDPLLAGGTVYDLMAQVDQLTSLAERPVQLRGIHALATIEEVAQIAIPDAGQRGWGPPTVKPLPLPRPHPVTGPTRDWSSFAPCTTPISAEPPTAPLPEPSPRPWPEVIDVAAYREDPLFAVQEALVTLCAARADTVAVLSLPQHYTPGQAGAWWRRMTGSSRVSGKPCSYAGLWYPFLSILEPSTPGLAPLRDIPPDGAACGTIAARELARGVWLAPANMALRGPVSLSPALSAAEAAGLFNNHGNIFVQKPGTFVALSAHTLSKDPGLLQLSVRRLLILLRKIALQRGGRYVFEPNTDRFRQLVRASFEQLMARLIQLGAIVAFQVVTDAGVNTQNDIDNGRLVIVLRVAPTSPVEFVTVTLVRNSEGLLNVVEG
ncbi:MAG: hypothetical protein NVSMB32_00100 [Actinomycetota bacterium]